MCSYAKRLYNVGVYRVSFFVFNLSLEKMCFYPCMGGQARPKNKCMLSLPNKKNNNQIQFSTRFVIETEKGARPLS